MRALVYAACAAFVLSLAALFLPRAKKPLPGEKTPAPAWLASLTGVFMAAGAPLFALERLASGLSADPAFLPGVSFGPLPWAFAALTAAAFCLMGAKRPVWLGACAWLSLVGAGVAACCYFAPVASEAFALVPVFKGAQLSPVILVCVCVLLFIALTFDKKRPKFIYFALWPSLVLLLVFLTGCGLTPFVRSVGHTLRAFLTGFARGFAAIGSESAPAANTLAFFAYWLCWSPAVALAARRASSGRSVREVIGGVYAAGLGAYLLLTAVFDAFGLRLLGSLADAGETTLALGESLSEGAAKLMLTLPFGSMCAALLWLGGMFFLIAAMGVAGESAAELISPGEKRRHALTMLAGGTAGLISLLALAPAQAQLGWRLAGWCAIPAAVWLVGVCALGSVAKERQ